MTRDELKRRVSAAVDRRAEEIIGVGERIRRHPGLGFEEVNGHGRSLPDHAGAASLHGRGERHRPRGGLRDRRQDARPAKALASMAIDMLGDGAAGARDVLARPRLQREAYLQLQRGMARREIDEGGAG
jgi:hypothetical protein